MRDIAPPLFLCFSGIAAQHLRCRAALPQTPRLNCSGKRDAGECLDVKTCSLRSFPQIQRCLDAVGDTAEHSDDSLDAVAVERLRATMDCSLPMALPYHAACSATALSGHSRIRANTSMLENGQEVKPACRKGSSDACCLDAFGARNRIFGLPY